jgi:hypothetical protein
MCSHYNAHPEPDGKKIISSNLNKLLDHPVLLLMLYNIYIYIYMYTSEN